MQNDQELLNMIKEAYPQAPRKEFIEATEMKLRQKARGMKKKSQMKKLSAVSSGLILFTFTFSWLFFFSGNEVLTNVASNLGAEALSATGSDKEPIVYIYQTHTIESYVDEINPADISKVFSDTKNVALVGKELSKELDKLDISTLHEETIFIQMTRDRKLSFKDAYKVSREVLQQTLNDHKSIKMMLDIHRDSFKREESTININGVDYAKIGLVVSKTTENYEENKEFALEIHEKLEKISMLIERCI